MSPNTSLGPGPTQEIQEEFVDLICADTDLMRAEFDAIIEAGWGGDQSPPEPGEVEGNAEPAHSPPRPGISDTCARRQTTSTAPCTITFRRRPRPPPGGNTEPP